MQPGTRSPLQSPPTPISPRRRHLYNLLAWLCFGLGFVGMVLPLMPTTVFWICATWLWLRSAPKRVRFLVEHPRFGASIRGFLERGEICRTGKTAAIGSMAVSWSVWYGLASPAPMLAISVAVILGLVALWIATRAEGPAPQPIPQAIKVTLDLPGTSRKRSEGSARQVHKP
ncbi:hypothetical protein CKO25_15345 [Thiocapsa imhoffii]|uniref:DUF454 domain-containing protein n=1 Tax=Thiocapsa imhoffii TaxID=382777 RepID=A0A9X0WK06_9GAMM|nr:YbaN family protein [Thiocapsa imhoffii]MBK1645998.1 hypothetical protein [Thiocapsa imhoffii]